jgi:uncharacterized membrane protein YbaN (DUF454 family)
MSDTAVRSRPTPARSRPVRWAWFGVGWVAVGIGSIGIVVPGLPTTVFFVVAASCFARSSPRFEAWVLGLPRIGPLVQDYRAGLGMSRATKAWAIAIMVTFATLGIVFAVHHPLVRLAIALLVVVGAIYIVFRVPTRERVLAERAGDPPSSAER